MIKKIFTALAMGLPLSATTVHAGTLKPGDFLHWQWESVVHENDDGTITPCRVQHAYFASNIDNKGGLTFSNVYDYNDLYSEQLPHDREQVMLALRSYNPNLPDPNPIQDENEKVCRPEAMDLS